jgi:hypothetical protein
MLQNKAIERDLLREPFDHPSGSFSQSHVSWPTMITPLSPTSYPEIMPYSFLFSNRCDCQLQECFCQIISPGQSRKFCILAGSRFPPRHARLTSSAH